MPNFQAKTRDELRGIPDAPQAPSGPFRVDIDDVFYLGVPHRYACTIAKDISAADLLRPGAFDNCTLRPWDLVEVTFGAAPPTAKVMKLLVVATPKHGLRGFERQAGLIERRHTIVAVVEHARDVTVNWGDEAPSDLDETSADTAKGKGKAA